MAILATLGRLPALKDGKNDLSDNEVCIKVATAKNDLSEGLELFENRKKLEKIQWSRKKHDFESALIK